MAVSQLYVIIEYSIVALLFYSLLISIAYSVAEVRYKRSLRRDITISETSKVIEVLKAIIKPEEEKIFMAMNKLTLTDLLTQEPTEANYREVVDILAEICEDTYSQYKFLIMKSLDETEDVNFMQIKSQASEMPGHHQDVFAKSLDYGLEMEGITKRFSQRVKDGDVIDLGDAVVVIVNDGTGLDATGVSPVNSGLEGGEIAFNISFILKENYEAWAKKAFKETEDE